MDITQVKPIDGVLWVCPACGKYAPAPSGLRDTSCFMHATPVHADSIQFDEWGLVNSARVLTPEEQIALYGDEL